MSKFGDWFKKHFIPGNGLPYQDSYYKSALSGSSILGIDFSRLGKLVDSMVAMFTQSAATGRDKELSDIQLGNQQLLNEQDYERKIDFYERYESPEAQVRQMKDAGINPALMYQGAPGVSASGGVGPGSASVPGASGSDMLTGLLSSLLGFKRLQLESSDIKSQISKRDSETEAQTIENKYLERKRQLEIQREQEEIERVKAEAAQVRANIPLILANTDYAQTMALYAPEYFDSTIGKNRADALRSQSEVSLNEKQKENLDAVIAVHKKEIQEIDAKIALISSEIELNASQKDLNDQSIRESQERIKKMEEEIRQIGVSIGLTEKDIEYYIWNHPRQSGGPFGIKWNNSSDNGRTGKLAGTYSEDDLVFLLRNSGYIVEKSE